MIVAKIVAERLLPPGTVDRTADRRKGRNGPVQVGILQADRQRAVTAHRVPGNPLSGQVGRERIADHGRQFGGDIIVHAVVLAPGRFGRVQIETGTQAEIPCAVRIVRHVLASRAGVRRDQHDAKLRCDALGTGLDHEGFFAAGQTGKVGQHRHWSVGCLRRRKHGKLHGA